MPLLEECPHPEANTDDENEEDDEYAAMEMRRLTFKYGKPTLSAPPTTTPNKASSHLDHPVNDAALEKTLSVEPRSHESNPADDPVEPIPLTQPNLSPSQSSEDEN